MITDDQYKYPIGKFTEPVSYDLENIVGWVNDLKSFPAKLKSAVANMSESVLDEPYREGGWKRRQVVHHLADSHMHALIRFKWALTEDNPVIKEYAEKNWAMLPDYELPVESSIQLLTSTHIHLCALLENLNDHDWHCGYVSSASGKRRTLKQATALYSWHGNHHLAQITNHLQNSQH